MPAKIRLSRHGKKGKPFYHVVVADSRAPRDGKFIEKIGSYDPNTNPATIDLNVEKAVWWLHKGAQPTDTTRAILSYKGVLYKKHLDVGVTKGVLTQDQADVKFAAWQEEKATKVEGKKSNLTAAQETANKARLAAEAKAKEAKAAAIAAKNTPAVEEVAVVEEAPADVVDETPATDAPAVESTETQEPTAEA